jgi:FtsP/CotA-like multicopper oxidase with cupredoxin domain
MSMAQRRNRRERSRGANVIGVPNVFPHRPHGSPLGAKAAAALPSAGSYAKCAALAGAISLLAACGSPDASAPQPPTQSALEVGQPDGWNKDVALTEVEDINPDPHILEFNLEAKVTDLEILPGHQTPVWTYNGNLPGPLIHVKVGDKIIAHFKNSLPTETTIHWHGMRLPNNMDGSPGVTQEPIAAGGEFTYEFVAKDAGTYWYHPHVDSSAQVGLGLYGPILVADPNDPKAFGDDLILVVSDMSLDENGQFLPRDNGGAFSDLFGREGSVLLVNGKVVPRLKVRAGKQQRWRIINAARARYYTIQLPNHTFVKLGGDNGLAERSESVNRILVTPSERADFVFTPSDAPGTVSMMKWIPPTAASAASITGPAKTCWRSRPSRRRPCGPKPFRPNCGTSSPSTSPMRSTARSS